MERKKAGLAAFAGKGKSKAPRDESDVSTKGDKMANPLFDMEQE